MGIETISTYMWILIVGIAFLIYLLAAKPFKKKETKNIFVFLAILAIAWGGLVEFGGVSQLAFFAATGETPTINGVVPSTAEISVTTYQPTATYSTKDKYSTQAIVGTSYYKIGNNPATSTSQTNVNEGDTIGYWVDNSTSTYWTQPAKVIAVPGVTPVQAYGWENSTVTMSIYDTTNKQSFATNTKWQPQAAQTSMGANKLATLEFTYVGPAKKSGGPFGGVVVMEYNSTISTVLCSGDDIAEGTGGFQMTYTPQFTSSATKIWNYKPSMDDGSGSVRTFDCQFQNGATAAGNESKLYTTYYPADYYVSQGGDILLDVEKAADGSTTRTTNHMHRIYGEWGA